jgi:hypothetical protein
MNPYEAFNHGQVSSKLWLCEELDKIVDNNKRYNVHILGGWHNVMSFMLIVRNQYRYKELHSYDLDPEAVRVASKICDTWLFDEPKVFNHNIDINDLAIEDIKDSIIINCSMDQMNDNEWFYRVPEGNIVCVQTIDSHPSEVTWYMKQYTPSLEKMLEKFEGLNVFYSGIKRIDYGSWGYNRLMLIGKK